MRAYTASLPILAAAILLTITTALDSEPPISNPQPENGIIANLLHEPRTEPVMHTYAVPRVAANLEGDIAPVLFVTNLEHDFPAWEAAELVDDVIGETQTLEPVRTPLPQISAVPHECPAQIIEYFWVNAGAACAVSRCESGWRLDAMNITPPDDSHGPFQINFYGTLGPDRLALVQSLGYPVTTQDEAKALLRSDWNASLRVASVLSSGGVNWSAWSCAPW